MTTFWMLLTSIFSWLVRYIWDLREHILSSGRLCLILSGISLFQILHSSLPSILNWDLCMVQDRDPVSLFHMWQFSFVNIIYCRGCSLSTVCFWLLGEKLIEHICMCLFLGSVFCSVLIYVSVSVSAPYSFHYYKFVM